MSPLEQWQVQAVECNVGDVPHMKALKGACMHICMRTCIGACNLHQSYVHPRSSKVMYTPGHLKSCAPQVI